MRRKPPKNPEILNLIRFLRKAKAPIWRYVAELLERPRRKKIVVNLSKINRYTSEGDKVVVPGVVLACGNIDHSVTVAALRFSEKSREKLIASKGRCLTIAELVRENPKGSGVKIII